MGAIKAATDAAFRDYVTDGVPASGANHPVKSEIRAALGLLDTVTLGPSASRKGNIAFFNNTTGAVLAAALAFNSGNPGNSALYSQLANPADGYLLPYNGLQISIGDPIGSGEQLGQGAVGVQQAIVGTAQTSATDAGNCFGLMGYAKSNAGLANAVGTGGWGAVNHTNGNAWGGNFICHNMQPVIANGGFATNWMSPIECDMNVWKGPGGAEMAHTNLFGIYIHGGGDSTTNQGTGVGLERLSVSTNAKWNNGFASRSGAAINAFVAGPAAFGGLNLDSQFSAWQAVNSGGSTITSRIWADSGGDFIFQSPSAGAHILKDGDNNLLLTAQNALGGAGIQLNRLGIAGIVTNTATGILNTTPIGTGVLAAVAISIGSTGGFVVRDGSLGSPSLVGTMPAFTMGGTISGGGNQINNVIIGASTPLAGTFTTLKATSLGVVNTSPKTLIDVNNNAASSPALVVSGSLSRYQAADSAMGGSEWVSYGASPQNILVGAIAGGTAAAPTATPGAKNMFNLRGYGYDSSAWQLGAIINLRSSNAWTLTNRGTQIDFYTTPNATTALAQVGAFNPAGGFSVGSLSATVEAGAGTLFLTPQTFASLATAAAGIAGAMAVVTDSTTNVWGATITGGGATKVLAFCNGAAWTVYGK
jgi:hypothetical protein